MKNHPDEIVEEIRRRREAHAASFDYDLERIVAELQRREKESGGELLELPPRAPVTKPKPESA